MSGYGKIGILFLVKFPTTKEEKQNKEKDQKESSTKSWTRMDEFNFSEDIIVLWEVYEGRAGNYLFEIFNSYI